MATKSRKQTKSIRDRFTTPVIESVHDVWLAGLGAVSLAQKEGSKFFDKLVAEGEKFEKETRKAVRERRAEATEQISSIAAKVSEPTNRFRKALKRGAEPVAYHLLPKDEGWTIRREGSEVDISLHTTKNAAMDAGRGLAQAHEPSRLIVHRTDGTIQTSYSYGEDA